MPLIATRGAASAQGFGEFAQTAVATYIEDVFSTYLYTGNGSSQTITNGIDLSGEGGLTWIKLRNGAEDHVLTDTVRGAGNTLFSNTTAANDYDISRLSSFTTSGFTLGASGRVNQNGNTYTSWTFRKQPKFFDVQTWTGTGTAGRQVAHDLGSVPGCVIIKSTSTAGEPWYVYHRSVGASGNLLLNSTDAASSPSSEPFDGVAPTSTYITLPSYNGVNGSGKTYVGYFFAHDAGGFGLTGSDNVITCGSYTGNGSTTGPTVTLGYEPQWLMIKASSTTGSWQMIDNMRGMIVGGNDQRLIANSSSAELSNDYLSPTATGFQLVSTSSEVNGSGQTYIYIAIRRGPMETPTSGTSVFTPSTRAGTGTSVTTSNLSFPPDAVWSKGRDNGGTNSGAFDRLRGATRQLSLNQGDAETTASTSLTGFDVMTGYTAGADAVQLTINATGYNYVNWQFRRAPGFFDVVCYTGTGVARTVAHNLGVAPEMYIVKARGTALASNDWWVNCAYLPTPSADSLVLNSTGANNTGNGALLWNSTLPTSSVFSLGTYGGVNTSGTTFVAYLFASCPGVSKVGSYTGTGTTLQVNCGFTNGSRFVLIKRTDSTGDWYVWDSARGIVAGNDPYLLLNSTAAEVTNTDYVDTYSAGFEISSTAPAGINANGGSYIFLAIA